MTDKVMPTAMISGGPISLKSGWAMIPFRGQKVHFWEPNEADGFSVIHQGERVRFWISLCGVKGQTYAGVPPLGPGNWPRCLRCLAAHQRNSEGDTNAN